MPWIKGGRIPSLDGLRGVSILLVTICHVPAMPGSYLPAGWKKLIVHGDLGVDVFFVISGFLITHLLLCEHEKHGDVSLRGFYWRRVWRIFPAYFFFLLTIAVLEALRLVQMDSYAWAAALTFNVDFMAEPAQYLIGHLWSLGVEEKFYLLWPSCLLLLGRTRAPYALAACLVIAPIVRFVGWEYWRDQVNVVLMFFARMDTLAVGCLLAYFVRTDRAAGLSARTGRFPTLLMVMLAGVVVLSAVVLSNSGKYALGPKRLIEASAIAGIVFLATTRSDSLAGRLLNWPPLVAVGILSYSLYLGQAMLFLPWPVQPWAGLLAALAYALVSYFLIEKPCLRFKPASR